jgi:hypothetical protein
MLNGKHLLDYVASRRLKENCPLITRMQCSKFRGWMPCPIPVRSLSCVQLKKKYTTEPGDVTDTTVTAFGLIGYPGRRFLLLMCSWTRNVV